MHVENRSSQDNSSTHILLNELKAMLVYATGQGRSLPAGVVAYVHVLEKKLAQENRADLVQTEASMVTAEELVQLAAYHRQMAESVKPAKPNSIHLVQQESLGAFKFLGPIALVRQLTVLALFFLVSTVLLALSSEVNRTTINQGIFESSGVVLLLNLLFLLCCAGLGATFSSLHQLFYYINSTTYDPKFNATYWIKIMMGLMSGLMIAELMPLDTLNSGAAGDIEDLDKPLIALLGGFSSDLLYRILSRILATVEQLFGKTEFRDTERMPSGPILQEHALTLRDELPENIAKLIATKPSAFLEVPNSANHSNVVSKNDREEPQKTAQDGLLSAAQEAHLLAESNHVQEVKETIKPTARNEETVTTDGQEPAAVSAREDVMSKSAAASDSKEIVDTGVAVFDSEDVTNKNTAASEKAVKHRVGQLTFDAEGTEGGPYHSRTLHVPRNTSGLTIGRGYDCKEKSPPKIAEDLIQAGLNPSDAQRLSMSSGLFGDEARAFIDAHQLRDFEISVEVQDRLFSLIYAELTADVKRICAKPDCVAAYGSVDWPNLIQAMKDVLVDLRYRGDYTPASRKLIQAYIANNDIHGFSRILCDKSFWPTVPTDRFERRKQHLLANLS